MGDSGLGPPRRVVDHAGLKLVAYADRVSLAQEFYVEGKNK